MFRLVMYQGGLSKLIPDIDGYKVLDDRSFNDFTEKPRVLDIMEQLDTNAKDSIPNIDGSLIVNTGCFKKDVVHLFQVKNFNEQRY